MFHRANRVEKTLQVTAKQQQARQAWHSGAMALRSGDLLTAGAEFTTAVKNDDEMTDAWLGLHAAGLEPDRALAQMQSYPQRLGEERTRTGVELSSTFRIGPYAEVPLSSMRQLWAAVGADYLDRGMYQHAQRAILGQLVPVAAGAVQQAQENFDAAVPDNDPLARYLVGRLEYLRSDVSGALYWFAGLEDRTDALAASALLMTGQLYASTEGQGRDKAMRAYDQALTLQGNNSSISLKLGADALLRSGSLAKSFGDVADASARFEHALTLFPALPGLAAAIASLP